MAPVPGAKLINAALSFQTSIRFTDGSLPRRGTPDAYIAAPGRPARPHSSRHVDQATTHDGLLQSGGCPQSKWTSGYGYGYGYGYGRKERAARILWGQLTLPQNRAVPLGSNGLQLTCKVRWPAPGKAEARPLRMQGA